MENQIVEFEPITVAKVRSEVTSTLASVLMALQGCILRCFRDDV